MRVRLCWVHDQAVPLSFLLCCPFIYLTGTFLPLWSLILSLPEDHCNGTCSYPCREGNWLPVTPWLPHSHWLRWEVLLWVAASLQVNCRLTNTFRVICFSVPQSKFNLFWILNYFLVGLRFTRGRDRSIHRGSVKSLMFLGASTQIRMTWSQIQWNTFWLSHLQVVSYG